MFLLRVLVVEDSSSWSLKVGGRGAAPLVDGGSNQDGFSCGSSRILILFIIIIIIIIIVKFRIYILFLFNLYNTLVQIKKKEI